MCTVSIFAVALWVPCFGLAQGREAPSYSAATILNSASGLPDSYAPNALLAIHGSGLANRTFWVDLENAKELPTVVPNAGTRVYIRNQLAGLVYVSPEQLLVVVPPGIAFGAANLQILVDARAGPAIPIRIQPVAPGLYLRAEGWAAATRADGSDVTAESPAVPGEEVTFYATGLGLTKPAVMEFTILRRAAPLISKLQVLLDGTAVEASAVEYAGLQPGSPGAYQIRCRLPTTGTGSLAPEIRLLVDGQLSQEGVRVPLGVAVGMKKLSRSTVAIVGSPGAVWSRSPRSIQLSRSPTRE